MDEAIFDLSWMLWKLVACFPMLHGGQCLVQAYIRVLIS